MLVSFPQNRVSVSFKGPNNCGNLSTRRSRPLDRPKEELDYTFANIPRLIMHLDDVIKRMDSSFDGYLIEGDPEYVGTMIFKYYKVYGASGQVQRDLVKVSKQKDKTTVSVRNFLGIEKTVFEYYPEENKIDITQTICSNKGDITNTVTLKYDEDPENYIGENFDPKQDYRKLEEKVIKLSEMKEPEGRFSLRSMLFGEPSIEKILKQISEAVLKHHLGDEYESERNHFKAGSSTGKMDGKITVKADSIGDSIRVAMKHKFSLES